MWRVSGLAALLTAVLAAGSAPAEVGERGDVNFNGIPYEIGDLTLTVSFYNRGAEALDPQFWQFQIAAMDADCDGMTPSIRDVIMMVRVVAGMEAPCTGTNGQRSAADVSPYDTLRIEDVSTNPGQTFWVPFYMRNIQVIGGYGIRVRYDSTLIEPVTFVHGTSTDIVHELLRGTEMEVHGGAIRGDGVATFLAVEMVNNPPFLSPGGGVTMRMQWRALPGSMGQQTEIRFEADSALPGSFNNMASLDGSILIWPTLDDGVVTVGTCLCPFPCDIDGNSLINAVDLAYTIDLVFFGASDVQDPNCPISRPDFNADGFVDATDMGLLINHVFFGAAGPVNPCAE